MRAGTFPQNLRRGGTAMQVTGNDDGSSHPEQRQSAIPNDPTSPHHCPAAGPAQGEETVAETSEKRRKLAGIATMSGAAKPGASAALAREAELDRLANEVDMDGLDEDDDDEDTEDFASMASELMQESVSSTPSNGVPAALNGASNAPRASASAPAVSTTLGSLMNRARNSGFAGLRFGPAAAGAAPGGTGPGSRDAFDVLGVREGARWRRVVTQDATRPAPTRPLSRSYRCDRGRVLPLDKRTATVLGVEAMRSAAGSVKIGGDDLAQLVEMAGRMGDAFLPEIERAIGSRLAMDPDFNADRFPKAAARFRI